MLKHDSARVLVQPVQRALAPKPGQGLSGARWEGVSEGCLRMVAKDGARG